MPRRFRVGTRSSGSRSPATINTVEERIHDDEPDTGAPVVRTLLRVECPQWANLPIEYLQTSGTDNAMWRVHVDHGTDVVVRLPRRPGSASRVALETQLLRQLSSTALNSIFDTPNVVHVGDEHEVFPYRWSVLEWIEGSDAWSSRETLGEDLGWLADGLAEAVSAIASVSGEVDAPVRQPGQRGGPMEALTQRIARWLEDPQWRASELVDVAAIRRLAAEGLEADGPAETTFVHGDLIPGNLLVRADQLAAILDWGGAGYGDLAQDLAPAWSVLDRSSRERFRRLVGATDADWLRARTIELEHAVGGVLYYCPRGHELGEVMAKTLSRILADQ